MELRILRYFLAVVQERNITKAADFLHVTQPTLSRQIQDLENELGQQLFIRGHHTITLTPAGMVFKKRAEEIMEMVGKTKAEFQFINQRIGGDVFIGSGETQAMALIAQVIKELQSKYPDIHFHLYSGNAEDVTERLNKGLLDFGLLIQPTDIAKYDAITLPVKDVWGVIMPKNRELAQKNIITKKDLLGQPLICSRQVVQKASSYNEFQKWFGNDFTKLNIVATYNLVFNALLLAESGIGYVISLDNLVSDRNNNVCFRPLYPPLESEINIVWKKHQIFSPAANIFLEALQKKFTA